MNAWQALDAELRAWQERGQTASLWWRDDDAIEPSPALDRLLALSGSAGAPLALAVIPDRATPALVDRLAKHRADTHRTGGATPLAVLQHGYAHRNHASAGRKKVELGAERPAAQVLEELARGGARLAGLFGGSAGLLPVLVPPWNRIDDGLLAALPGLGLTSLSRYGSRGGRNPAPSSPDLDLTELNTHVDIMRWSDPRGFAGEAAGLELLCGHLAARRTGACDPDEPTGLLTHHLVHDEPAWAFLERLLPTLAAHPGARLLSPAEAFAAPKSQAETGIQAETGS